MTRVLVRLVCWVEGHQWRWQRNIYGDEIYLAGGRSWWRCRRCSRREVRSMPVTTTCYDEREGRHRIVHGPGPGGES